MQQRNNKMVNIIKRRAIACCIFICILFSVFATGCGLNNSTKLSDGNYEVDIKMQGGTGKAYIESPATLCVENGNLSLTVVWSSVNYDYMIVDDNKYLNENVGGPSTFTFPISDLDNPLTVIGDTTAMSVPHEIEYVISMELR